ERRVRADPSQTGGLDQRHREPRGPEPAHEEVRLEGPHALEERWIRGLWLEQEPTWPEQAAGAADAHSVTATAGCERHVVPVAGEEDRGEREAKKDQPEPCHGPP